VPAVTSVLTTFALWLAPCEADLVPRLPFAPPSWALAAIAGPVRAVAALIAAIAVIRSDVRMMKILFRSGRATSLCQMVKARLGNGKYVLPNRFQAPNAKCRGLRTSIAAHGEAIPALPVQRVNTMCGGGGLFAVRPLGHSKIRLAWSRSQRILSLCLWT
jgi:hypothetical protein